MSTRKKKRPASKRPAKTGTDLGDAMKEVFPLIKEVFALVPAIRVLGSGRIWPVGLQLTAQGPMVSVSGTIDIAALKQLAAGTEFHLKKI